MKRVVAAAPLLIFVALGIFFTSHAQFGGTEPLYLEVTPIYPRPYQTVTVTPMSNEFDLNAAAITVSANGTVVNRTTGSEPSYVTVGNAGTATNITVTAVIRGATYTKSVVLRPAEVSLVLEPVSTAHPFYNGGSLTASGGTVRLVAIPGLRTSNGVAVPPANLVYTWKLGEQILQASSGIGKSVLVAEAPPRYRDARITVTVATQDESLVAESSVTVSASDPEMHVYLNDPLLGPFYNVAVPNSYIMNDTEASFRAVPYYFAAKPSLTWSVNGSASETTQDITVRSSGDGAGSALIGVSATGNSTQTAQSQVSVQFGKNSVFDFLGL